MKIRTNFFVALFLLLPFMSVTASEPKPYEMPRTQVVSIQDSKADRQYELYIKLPEEYSENTDRKYPVIYTTDAIWHFDMLSGATEYLMPNVILVGVSWQTDLDDERAHVSRFRDYTVKEHSDPEIQAQYQPGQAGNHMAFIRDDVITYVEANFRADPSERTYFGYSLGGQFGAYILLAQPDIFKHYILGSPAFGGDSDEYLDALEAETAPGLQDIDANVFVTIGELETDKMLITENFVSVLKRRTQKGLAVTGPVAIEAENHGGAFPMTAIRSINWLSELTSETSETSETTP